MTDRPVSLRYPKARRAVTLASGLGRLAGAETA
jgi:hypothetical protein